MNKNTNLLHGLRVLNTRPLEQGQALTQAIQLAGGVSIHIPALTIEPTNTDWVQKLPDLKDVQQAIFISANAVHYFFSPLEQQQINWPSTLPIIAIGKATAAALEKWRVGSCTMPPLADSESLLQLDTLQHVKNKTIMLIKGEGGRVDIADTLLKRGAHLMPAVVYRRTLPNIESQHIHSLWHDNAVDIILFTSQQAMQNIFTLFGAKARSWLCSKPCVVISERLAKKASLLGMQTVFVSHYDRIVDTLCHLRDNL